MEGSVLKEVTQHKHVGIILSQNLSWNKHICFVEERARSALTRLSQFRNKLDRKSLEQIYMSLIRPIMEYGDVVWDGGFATDLERLEKIQKDAARVVTGATARCNSELLMRDVAWPSLAARRRSHKLTLFYKMVNGLSPPYLKNLLPTRVGVRSRYALRTEHNFTVPYCKTNTFAKSFLPSTVSEWNSLDLTIKNAISLPLFKNMITPKITRNSLFYYGPRWENIHLSRMRIGCSNLKSHLCHNLHVEESPACQCGHPDENVKHFFLECPLYAAHRHRLFQVLDSANVSDQLILHGDNAKSIAENMLRLDSIYQYMRDTRRFQRIAIP